MVEDQVEVLFFMVVEGTQSIQRGRTGKTQDRPAWPLDLQTAGLSDVPLLGRSMC